MIEERRPCMWWSASTTMRLAHTLELDTLTGGTLSDTHVLLATTHSKKRWLMDSFSSQKRLVSGLSISACKGFHILPHSPSYHTLEEEMVDGFFFIKKKAGIRFINPSLD
jgi:hypothetical protein